MSDEEDVVAAAEKALEESVEEARKEFLQWFIMTPEPSQVICRRCSAMVYAPYAGVHHQHHMAIGHAILIATRSPCAYPIPDRAEGMVQELLASFGLTLKEGELTMLWCGDG